MSGPGNLEGRAALVTGAAGGIGRAVVRDLQAAGARVTGFDRVEGPEGLAWVRGDVGDDETVRRAVAAAVERHGGLDVLVHAAGIARDAVVWKLQPADWDAVQAVNLRGAYLLLRHAVPVMRSGGGGRVVLIGSINGSRGKFGQTAYAASKAGLIGLAKSAARETARFGILVNVVEPGMIRTPMTESLPEPVVRDAEREILLGRLGEPEDVAGAVLYLCGPRGRHVTGQILRVDGGQYL